MSLGRTRAMRALRHGAEAQTMPKLTSMDSQVQRLNPSHVASLDFSFVIEK